MGNKGVGGTLKFCHSSQPLVHFYFKAILHLFYLSSKFISEPWRPEQESPLPSHPPTFASIN